MKSRFISSSFIFISDSIIQQSLLFGKLNQAKTIVSKTLLLVDNSQSREIIELRDALKSLNINDIEVDVTSTKLMMNEELAILRNSTHLQRDKVSGSSRKDSSERSSDEISKIMKLEEENSKFRELLEQSSKELRLAQIETQRITSAVPSPDQNLLNEIEVLKSEVCQDKVIIAEQGSAIARLEKEVGQLSNTIEVVKKEAEETVRTTENRSQSYCDS